MTGLFSAFSFLPRAPGIPKNGLTWLSPAALALGTWRGDSGFWGRSERKLEGKSLELELTRFYSLTPPAAKTSSDAPRL